MPHHQLANEMLVAEEDCFLGRHERRAAGAATALAREHICLGQRGFVGIKVAVRPQKGR